MSIIFGVKKPEGDVVEERQLLNVAQATNRWAPDGTFVRAMGRIGMGFQPYHTHQRSNLESQPAIDDVRNMISMDGRLDNHKELRGLLNIEDPEAPDSVIVLAAFRLWGEECFSRFIGDWALAIWCATTHSVFLARDHAGTRTLFAMENEGSLYWGSFLETLLSAPRSQGLDPHYLTRYLSFFSSHSLTPYRGVYAVPPAHCMVFKERRRTCWAHWTPEARTSFQPKSVPDYEEALLFSFRQAVKRRVLPGSRVISHLSGGMDSSSIVCMADLINHDKTDRPAMKIETISYYDPSEPTWDEEPYFSVVEKRRGQIGFHIHRSYADRGFDVVPWSEAHYYLPGADASSIIRERQFQETVGGTGNIAILAGYGGDELLGGRPDPLPELGDLAGSFELRALFIRSFEWCLALRQPLYCQVGSLLGYLTSLYAGTVENRNSAPKWINSKDSPDLQDDALLGQGPPTMFMRPSRIHNKLTWRSIVDTLPHQYPEYTCRYEYRYPFLDRELMELLFQIPRSQLLQPDRRRTLMRRSFRHLLPSQILERRRKALLTHGPLRALQANQKRVRRIVSNSILAEMGIVNIRMLGERIEAAICGTEGSALGHILRFIALELWIRHIHDLPLESDEKFMRTSP
jgi:asparagine synthase (glutamine-hydrolysing)